MTEETDSPLEPPERNAPLKTLWLSFSETCPISDWQSCEIINTCSLKATTFGVFVMAPNKTNTGGHGCCN